MNYYYDFYVNDIGVAANILFLEIEEWFVDYGGTIEYDDLIYLQFF